MRRFLRETWELWYWAMFCPSKLQHRMNEWAPAKEKDGQRPDTHCRDILLFRFNSRFFRQCLLLLLCFSLPLTLTIAIKGQGLDWLLLPVVLLIAYGANCWFLPAALSIPLIYELVYLEKPEAWSDGLNQAFMLLSPLPQLGSWLTTQNSFFVLFVTAGALVGGMVSRQAFFVMNGVAGGLVDRVAFVVVISVAGSLVGGLAFAVAFVVAAVMAGVMAVVVAGVMAVVVAGWLALVVAGWLALVVRGVIAVVIAVVVAVVVAIVVAVVVAIVVAGMATLSLPLFLLVCWLIAFSFVPAKNLSLGIWTASILAALAFEHLGWWSLLAAPVVFLGYYRILPDYLMLNSISLLSSLPLFSLIHPQPLQRLQLLPPHTTELLWLPLPNHDRILAAAFRQNSSAALVTFQQMQTLALPGFQGTIKKALPQIVADQLAAVHTIPELLATVKPEHPLLPLLVPIFYQQNTELEEQFNLNTASPVTKAVNRLRLIGSVVLVANLIAGTLLILLDAFWAVLLGSTFAAILGHITAETLLNDLSGNTEDGNDINRLLPRLQAVAQDVNAVLNVGSVALRDRGLERILNNLGMLQPQLPGLGLKAPAIKRWEPVIKRWQQVIQLELEEQQKQSQGELLNPFQYGNPLRRDRSYLFKGRRAFADNIVRLVLDRNRPTLVLHGPRRFGKSSFLLNLPRLLPSDMLPIYLDMQSAAVTTDEASFCQGIVRAISKDSRSQGVELPAIPQRKEFLDTPYIALEDWLEQALPKLGDRRLLLNLDEFEKIGNAINEGRMSLNLFNELRHLIQHYDQLGFLFSGVQTLDELGPNWSSYFISVVPIEMLYLEPHEAEDLLVNPDPEFTLRYHTGIVEQILTLTHCQPYLLQLIGSSLVTLANENHTQLVTSDLLQASIPEAFTNGQPYFTNVWTEFTGTSPTEVKAGQELLLALAQGHQPSSVASDETVQAARQRLLRYHVIEHINGSDRFEVPLIERWVRERAIRN